MRCVRSALQVTTPCKKAHFHVLFSKHNDAARRSRETLQASCSRREDLIGLPWHHIAALAIVIALSRQTTG